MLWSGDTKAAIDAMHEVARVQPILTEDEYFDLGIAYLIAGQTDDAITTLGRAIQRYDDNAQLCMRFSPAPMRRWIARPTRPGEAEIVKRMLPAFQAKDFATRLRDQGQRSKVIAALQLAGL